MKIAFDKFFGFVIGGKTLNVEYIREFIVMAEVCNYTQAAEKLFISESTLFRHIKSLEEELGIQLFEKRNSKRVFLTKYGNMLIPYATKILHAKADFLQEVDQVRMEENSMLLIGTQYRISDLVKGFYEAYPNRYLVQLIQGGTDKLLKAECELLVCCDLSLKQDIEFDSVIIKEEQLAVVLPKNHLLANSTSIRLEQLRGEKFIIVSDMRGDTDDYDEALKFCQSKQFKPRIVMKAPTGTEVAKLVSEGMGIALLYKFSNVSTMVDQVAIVDLDPQVKFPITIRWKKDKELSEAGKFFIDFAVKHGIK